jgi:type I restriction-modification system DNA methylase subunit
MNSLENTANAQTPDSGSTLSISRAAATKFAEKWKDTVEEQQNDQAFWQDFFRDLLGISNLQESGVEFQKKVKSSKTDTTTRIDVFWKDTFLVEHKSAGKDLEAAEVQAREYVFSLPPAQRPPIIIICDFARFRIVDYVLNKSHEFRLEDLADNLERIEAIVSHKTNVATTVQVEADQKAAQLMADLYVQLEKYGYEGHEASVFMVRILFCLFADDTRMWKSGIFQELVKDTNEQGSDLGPRLSTLFTVLDTPKDQRKGPQDAFLADFPYVNGGIFSERLETIHFNQPMRQALINTCNYDWAGINPTIFGALFQDIKSKEARRENGEHYTSETNIAKVIEPLFLQNLHQKLEDVWDNSSKLKELQKDLGTYQILDPACGCGNFLITTYKRLRQLELEIIVRIKQLDGTTGQTSLFDVTEDIHVKLEQLHGIEYVEWSSQIAKVAIYLADHQENIKLESVLGVAPNRFPLSQSANIVLGNALQLDWQEVCPMTDKTFIVGNPPFYGARWQSPEQKADTERTWEGVKGYGDLDYVTNWFRKAAPLISAFDVKVAFVATNSISQGIQPALIWGELYKFGVDIDFAHKSFLWSNEASGQAAVYVVIVGMSRSNSRKKHLWTYTKSKGIGTVQSCDNINAYLLAAPNILITSRKAPLQSSTPLNDVGSMPNDGGFLSNLSDLEVANIREQDPIASRFLKPLVGAQELLNSGQRWCLWLTDVSPEEIRQSPVLSERVEQVRQLRSESNRPSTQKLAKTPWLFGELRQPAGDYIAIPRITSENRDYVPMDILSADTVINDKCSSISGDNLRYFSVLQSSIFNVWNNAISGRTGMSTLISNTVTYNNFPFPEFALEVTASLEACAREILEARKQYPGSSLADLYDPKSMPISLQKAHARNDLAVKNAYGIKNRLNDDQVLQHIFSLYVDLSKNLK